MTYFLKVVLNGRFRKAMKSKVANIQRVFVSVRSSCHPKQTLFFHPFLSKKLHLRSLLVGGLEHEFYFSIYIGNVIIPTDFHSIIFQRGWLKPPEQDELNVYNGISLELSNIPHFFTSFVQERWICCNDPKGQPTWVPRKPATCTQFGCPNLLRLQSWI